MRAVLRRPKKVSNDLLYEPWLHARTAVLENPSEQYEVVVLDSGIFVPRTYLESFVQQVMLEYKMLRRITRDEVERPLFPESVPEKARKLFVGVNNQDCTFMRALSILFPRGQEYLRHNSAWQAGRYSPQNDVEKPALLVQGGCLDNLLNNESGQLRHHPMLIQEGIEVYKKPETYPLPPTAPIAHAKSTRNCPKLYLTKDVLAQFMARITPDSSTLLFAACSRTQGDEIASMLALVEFFRKGYNHRIVRDHDELRIPSAIISCEQYADGVLLKEVCPPAQRK